MGMATLHEMMARMELAPPAAGDDIAALEAATLRRLPEDYPLILRWSDGAEGYVGGRGYLRLWSAGDVIRFNEAYRVSEFLPDVVLFRSDAAAIGYGFDFAAGSSRVVAFELAGMHRDYVWVAASSFPDLVRLRGREPLPHGTPELLDHKPPDWATGSCPP